jgi:hypothetical protein
MPVLAAALGGCAAMERMQMAPTEPYYLAHTSETFPPKPRKYAMPMLAQPPPNSRPIGLFQFKTTKGRGHATEAATYNARRVGADAIWVRGIQEWAEPYAYDIPSHWESQHRTVFRRRIIHQRGSAGQPDSFREITEPETILTQVWVPAQHISGIHHFTSVDSVMYRNR